MTTPVNPSAPDTRLSLFPITTRVVRQNDRTELTIAGQSLKALADRFGTPLYLYDQATMNACLSAYQQALQRHYPGTSGITYAGKAFLCLAIAQWVRQKGITLDCSSAGEMHIAKLAGLTASQLIAHGVNKSPADLQTAIDQAGTIVVDNLFELARLCTIFKEKALGDSSFPDIWLRLRPGVKVSTHSHIQTGQQDSKFGLSPSEFMIAVKLCLEAGLPLKGLHFHLGSHIHASEPLVSAIGSTLDLILRCQQQTGWLPEQICPGGGWGVAYHEDDLPHPPIEELVAALSQSLIAGCRTRSLSLFHLQLEPGRSLVAQAGVAVYQIGAVKHTPSRRYLLIDGGLADNPRPALYQARYSALPVSDPLRHPDGSNWVAGPFCESGDILIENIPLPDLDSGELIVIPVSGAYQLSMSSNYNSACRPAVLWLQDQQAYLIQIRETVDDLSGRDRFIPD